MKPITLILVLGLTLSGAAHGSLATPFNAPADAANLKLERADSRNVVVEKIWLERKHGPLAVCGYVLKRLRGDDTDQTILEVTLFDASGAVLRRATGQFSPQHLVRHLGHAAIGSYRIELGELPAGTARIVVRAQDAGNNRERISDGFHLLLLGFIDWLTGREVKIAFPVVHQPGTKTFSLDELGLVGGFEGKLHRHRRHLAGDLVGLGDDGAAFLGERDDFTAQCVLLRTRLRSRGGRSRALGAAGQDESQKQGKAGANHGRFHSQRIQYPKACSGLAGVAASTSEQTKDHSLALVATRTGKRWRRENIEFLGGLYLLAGFTSSSERPSVPSTRVPVIVWSLTAAFSVAASTLNIMVIAIM